MAQSDLIWYSKPNIYGNKFRCSKRTGAHLDRTRYRLQKLAQKRKKSYELRIIQGSYNSSVDASAGTHDFDAVLDVQIVGMDWYEAQRWLRRQGWAAWVREPPTFSWHIHMISLPPYKLRWVSKVGYLVSGQVNDYYAKKSGLVGHYPDPTWHPSPIAKTIFNYNLWMAIVATRRQISRLSDKLSEARRKLKRLLSK
jgi:hypothetical protein